jgi:hypothetical protein
MKPLDCGAARRRLNAFHDGELSVEQQIAVASHLEWCDACAEEFADFGTMRDALQAIAPGRAALSLSHDQAAVFTATVISRAKAEDQASFVTRVRGMFEDLHLVYAGVGAAVATAICVVVMLSMMRYATSERPDSLAAVVSLVAAPLECDFGADLADASSCKARLAARFQRANETAETDAVFALETIVTRQGKLTNLETLRSGRHESASQAKLIEGLLDHVSKSRFESGPPPHHPDFSSIVWLVEHATVRANTTKPALDLQLPPKKRAARPIHFSAIA